jgi:hypothetical protein
LTILQSGLFCIGGKDNAARAEALATVTDAMNRQQKAGECGDATPIAARPQKCAAKGSGR